MYTQTLLEAISRYGQHCVNDKISGFTLYEHINRRTIESVHVFSF